MARNILFFVVGLFLIGCLTDCYSESSVDEHLLTFDVSPDGNSIVFAAVRGQESSIYKMNIADKNIKVLFEDKDSVSLFAPKFNENGDSIVFISSDFPKAVGTTILIGDADGKGSRVLSDDLGIKTEVIFSNDENSLYYLQGAQYDKYSPLGRKAPHAFDIYKMDKNSKKTIKISNYEAYTLSSISEVSDSILLFSGKMSIPGGLFFFNTGNNTTSSVVIDNDSVGIHGNEYSTPVLVNDHTLLATIYYRLVSLDLVHKKERTIFKAEGNHFGCVRYSKKLDKIFVSIYGQNLIYILDKEGEILDEIQIKLDF